MSFHFQFRRYHLALKVPIRTAHERWTTREGLLLRVEDRDGRVGFGEVAPIPAFGTETIEQAEALCRALGEWPTEALVDAVPRTLGCVRQAIAVARQAIDGTRATPANTSARSVAALLPAGRAALETIGPASEIGFRVFKWKVGVGDVADELALLDDLCGELPNGSRLRLDANGAWDRRLAERWLERCAERPIEYVEQPCFAPRSLGEGAVRHCRDLLFGLAGDYPTPVALDESVISEADAGEWIAQGWPGWYVIKPSLLGDAETVLGRLAAAKATVVFSSALETAVGASSALRTAFAWGGEPKALGFGVWPLFADPRFDGPAAAPFIRWEDVQRQNPEQVWNALS